jgi:hypothetical protein
MYSQRQRIYPALGKEREVRTLMDEWVRAHQAKGRDLALLTRVFSSEGSGLVVVTRANDLATLEQHRHENAADPDFQARAARLVEMVRQPVQTSLFEMVVPVSGGASATGIVVRAHGYPKPGKERQGRSIVEEVATSGHAAGLRQGVGVGVFSGTGSVIELTTVYADLAELDRVRKERAQIMGEASRAFGELSRAPIASRMFEVVVPFKS